MLPLLRSSPISALPSVTARGTQGLDTFPHFSSLCTQCEPMLCLLCLPRTSNFYFYFISLFSFIVGKLCYFYLASLRVAHAHVCLCRGQRRTSGILLYPSGLIPLRQGLLVNVGLNVSDRLAGQRTSGMCMPLPHPSPGL